MKTLSIILAIFGLGFVLALGLGAKAIAGVMCMIVLALGIGVIYFVPTIIAAIRKSENLTIILILNIVLGWSTFGWIFVLAVSLFL